MKLLLIIVCVCITQVYSGEIINKYFPTPNIWRPVNAADLERYRERFGLIKEVSFQAIGDVINVMSDFRENYAVAKLFGELAEVLLKDLQASENVLNASFVEQFFEKIKETKELYKSNEIEDLLNEFESIFSEKLKSSEVARIMTLIRILEGTPMKIQNSLNYLYGLTTESTLTVSVTTESSTKTCMRECIDRCL